MKKFFILFSLLFLVGCSSTSKTTSFRVGTDLKDNFLINPSIKFVVIGYISESLKNINGEMSNLGIRSALLKKAKQKFGKLADDVVDIAISYNDTKTSKKSFFGNSEEVNSKKIYEARVIHFIKVSTRK